MLEAEARMKNDLENTHFELALQTAQSGGCFGSA